MGRPPHDGLNSILQSLSNRRSLNAGSARNCRSRCLQKGRPGAWSEFTATTPGEVALNQQVKDLIQKLGEAIHESMSESEQIAGVVRDIRKQGFDVLLMLEATIGLNEIDEDDASGEDQQGNEVAAGPFTRNDLSFLKSLRITAETVGADNESSNPS